MSGPKPDVLPLDDAPAKFCRYGGGRGVASREPDPRVFGYASVPSPACALRSPPSRQNFPADMGAGRGVASREPDPRVFGYASVPSPARALRSPPSRQNFPADMGAGRGVASREPDPRVLEYASASLALTPTSTKSSCRCGRAVSRCGFGRPCGPPYLRQPLLWMNWLAAIHHYAVNTVTFQRPGNGHG